MKKEHQNIKKELEELGIPLEHHPNIPLSIPSGYFDSFKKDMLEQIATLDFTEQLSRKMPQQVPTDYFEQSKADILNQVTTTDFSKQLPKEMPQQLPVGYFEQSQQDILAAIASDGQTMGGLQLTRTTKYRNWALAASMALIVSIGLFFINSKQGDLNLENELAQIPAEMIDNYIDEHQYDFEAFDILENPEIITKDVRYLEDQILNETKTLSNEEIFEFVL